MKRIFALFLTFCLFLTLTLPVVAATKKPVAQSITASGAFIKPKNVVRALFTNMRGVKNVSYTLYYQGSGIGQGVVGNFAPGKKTTYSKDLYLGTCSRKVCIQHRNVKNIQLEVITKFTNGKSSTKVYKVK